MFETIERPSTGKPMRAAWGARIADRVNELCGGHPQGMLSREGFGSFAEPIPHSKRLPRPSSSLPPMPFDPVFKEEDDSESGDTGDAQQEDDKKNLVLSDVGWGLVPYGRKFYGAKPEIDQAAKVKSGFIGLEIAHETRTGGPSFKIVLIGEGSDEPDMRSFQQTDEKTTLPLYAISDGKISLDCRCLLALAIRE